MAGPKFEHVHRGKWCAACKERGAREERARLLGLIPSGWACHESDECDYCRVVRLLSDPEEPR